jgi:hypothetical protein
MPNPNRPSNPFTPSPEPDWVDVQRMGGRPEPPPARGSQRARTVDFASPSTSNSSAANLHHNPNAPARKLIVPAFPTHATQPPGFDGNRDALNDLNRSASNASTRSLPTRPGHFTSAQQQRGAGGPQVLRKPAPPPIPTKKPALLSKNSSQSMQQYRDDPRRSMAERKPVAPNSGNNGRSLLDEDDETMARPPLPPRAGWDGGSRKGRPLLDDEDEDGGNLRGWEVLQPQTGR